LKEYLQEVQILFKDILHQKVQMMVYYLHQLTHIQRQQVLEMD